MIHFDMHKYSIVADRYSGMLLRDAHNYPYKYIVLDVYIYKATNLITRFSSPLAPISGGRGGKSTKCKTQAQTLDMLQT